MTAPPPAEPSRPTSDVPTAQEIGDWLALKLGEALRVSAAEIQRDEPLVRSGLDSMRFVVLVGELEQWLGCRFTDNPLIDYPTINSLSVYLAEQVALGNKLIDPTQR